MIREVIFAAGLLGGLAAYAADLPREFAVTQEMLTEAPAYLTRVVVPAATCAAVNDAASLLVVGHRGKDDQHLAVFHLDANGQPSGEPSWVTLPKPEALAKNQNYPLGLLFHPHLPLLYVWQDVNGPPGDKQEKNPEFADYLEFDHLLVYAIKDGALELVQSGARGVGFHCGLPAGTIGLDFAAKHLFVPNATGGTYDEGGIGVYTLDEEGLPSETPEVADDKPTGPGLLKTNVSKNPNKKILRSIPAPKKIRANRYYPTGLGWFASAEATLMGGYSGCMITDFHNGSLRQTWFGLPDRSGQCSVAGHPTLPAAYLCLLDDNHFVAIAQVDGYLTLLPQIATVPAAHFSGIPVVLTGQSRLAVGDRGALHLFGLGAEGKLDGKDELLKIPCAITKGIAYSENHHRLFVAVDKAE
jgi:hypothetical protein